MKKASLILVTSLASSLLAACSDNDYKDITSPIEFDFTKDSYGFSVLFSDYPEGEEAFFQLEGKYTKLPEEFEGKNGWFLKGNNHSDDLLMAVRGSLSGLRDNTMYSVSIDIEFLTRAPSNCSGIGGAPGESVFVKLATAKEKPTNLIEDGMYRINTDIGFQGQSGTEGVVVGDLANGQDCNNVSDFPYLPKKLSTELPIDVMSNDYGEIWFLAATDSGFEGLSSLYITKLTATIKE